MTQHCVTPTPLSPADAAVRTAPDPFSAQTRAALLAEVRFAAESSDWSTVLGVELAAVEFDAAYPDEVRLMDEVRAIVGTAKRVA